MFVETRSVLTLLFLFKGWNVLQPLVMKTSAAELGRCDETSLWASLSLHLLIWTSFLLPAQVSQPHPVRPGPGVGVWETLHMNISHLSLFVHIFEEITWLIIRTEPSLWLIIILSPRNVQACLVVCCPLEERDEGAAGLNTSLPEQCIDIKRL